MEFDDSYIVDGHRVDEIEASVQNHAIEVWRQSVALDGMILDVVPREVTRG